MMAVPYDYEAKFEMIAKLNGWDVRAKAIFLAVSLDGSARLDLAGMRAGERFDFAVAINTRGVHTYYNFTGQQVTHTCLQVCTLLSHPQVYPF